MISNVCISHFVYYEKSKTKKVKQAAKFRSVYPFLIMKDETSLWFNNYYCNFLISVFLHLTFSLFSQFFVRQHMSLWHNTTYWWYMLSRAHTANFFRVVISWNVKKWDWFFLPENLFLSLASITGYFIAVLSLFCLLNLIFVTAGGES